MKIGIGNCMLNQEGFEEDKAMDLYSLKKELDILNNSSNVFDNLEKESMHIDKDALEQIEDFNLLLKIRRLSSEIKSKKAINDKLNTLHFSLNTMKNSDSRGIRQIKNTLNLFLYNDETKINSVIWELSDFKSKINEIKSHYSKLLPKSLDNKLKIEDKYNRHVGQLQLNPCKAEKCLHLNGKIIPEIDKKSYKKSEKL